METIVPTKVQIEGPRRRLAVVDPKHAAVAGAEVVVRRTIEDLARETRRRRTDEDGSILLDSSDDNGSSLLVSKEGLCGYVGWIGDLPTSRGNDGKEIRTVVLQSPRRLDLRVVDAFSGALVLDATVQAFAPYGAEAECLEGASAPQVHAELCPVAKAPVGIAQLSIDPDRRYRVRASAFGYVDTKVEVLPGKEGVVVFKPRWFATPDDEEKIA